MNTGPDTIAFGANRTGRILRRSRRKRSYPLAKRALDVGAVLLTAPISIPIVLSLALLVRRDGGKAFYRQDRLGKNGRTFKLWKLRTMVPDAERFLVEYLEQNPEAAREWHETQKLRRDPRVTRLGEFMRKHSIDELPQLWNVLIGDMSLVGPRPMLPDQEALYPGHAYFLMRPGLTGLWQISARNDGTFASRAAYDDRYEEIKSLRVDLAIMLSTVGVVVRGTGL
ncbi:sugar transferase [Microbaculum marinisediminis]|uniref:sugar transferase n=1 Tax=Microbaculum marinisediminis TaxID=2931392 RepID=UPI0021BF0FAB|nr:sugar transferase [Microbaculum sp. A6E488]